MTLRKLFIVLLVLSASAWAWDCGVDFRATAGYVSDPAYGVYNLAANRTANNANGDPCNVTMGVGSLSGRDRTTGVDARLAGIVFTGSSGTFTLATPGAGTYAIGMAIGDASNPQSAAGCTVSVAVFDNATPLFTASYTGAIGTAEFVDATGVKRSSAAAWVSGNATYQVTTSTSTLKFTLSQSGSGCTSAPLAHVRATSVSVGTRRRPPIVAMVRP